MLFWQAIMAARDFGRLHEIASILIRYGFGDMVRRMGLANALERTGRVLRWNVASELAQLEPHAQRGNREGAAARHPGGHRG